MTTSQFKSPEHEERYLNAYNTSLTLWPITPETQDIATHFGTTHINIIGSDDLPPLILLHGFGMSSTMWYANIEPLSQHCRVYAIDLINQLGLSVATEKLKSRQDCSDWLGEVLDMLDIQQAIFMGHSYGGWFAMNFALASPQQVERLILLSPAPALARINWGLFLRMIPVLFMPIRRMFYWLFQWTTTMSLNRHHPLIEQFFLGTRCFKPDAMSYPITSVFKDDELQQIHVPTLLLVGEREVVYDPDKVLDRARSLMPNIEAEIITDGGHLFPVDQAEATNDRISKFLER